MPTSDNGKQVRQGFTFFRSFRDAVALTDPDEQLVLYKAIADYALDQIEPDVSTLGALGRLCWTAIRPNIESGLVRFRNGCRGGAPKGNRNACKTTEKQPRIYRETTDPLPNENENENGKMNGDGNGHDKELTSSRSRFVAPSQKEIEEYILEKGLEVDAACFFNHYTANGWMVGRNRMKDWRAALRNWSHREATSPTGCAPAARKKSPDHETPPVYKAL